MFRTVPPPSQRILVFARLPERGAVKTRLAASIGDDNALLLYEAMLFDLLRRIGDSDAETEVEVLWAPAPTADGASLTRAFGHRSLAMQTGANLGDRMAMAFSERFFFHRTMKIVAIGVDEPSIDRTHIDNALSLLESCEWVIGPALDGGYYLIGCRAAAFDSEVFADVAWGTSSVFQETLAKIRATGNSVGVLPVRRDIDVIEDLRAYAEESAGGELAELIHRIL